MSWNYRVFAEDEPLTDGEAGEPVTYRYYSIRNVYYDDSKKPKYYSSDPAAVEGDSVDEIREELNRMLEALNKPIMQAGDF